MARDLLKIRVVTVIVFMACSKAHIWALHMPPADTKGHEPGLRLATAQGPCAIAGL